MNFQAGTDAAIVSIILQLIDMILLDEKKIFILGLYSILESYS